MIVESAKLGALPSYIGRPLALLLALDIAVAIAYVFGGWKWLSLPDVPLSIFGGVIGVLAGFRNATAYARWWEARVIWGAVVNSSRSFARAVLTMIVTPDHNSRSEAELGEAKHKLVTLQIAYVHALRHQLRGTPPWPELSDLISETEMEDLRTQDNIPLAIQQTMSAIVARCYRRGWIDDMRWVHLAGTLSSLMDCQGAAERIKNTPMPLMYDLFIQLFTSIYCFVLPLGMVASLRLWTPIGSTLVGFIFLALDRMGRDLEAPFANLPNDIALTAITRMIEINLKQMIGETEVPRPIAPVDGILW